MLYVKNNEIYKYPLYHDIYILNIYITIFDKHLELIAHALLFP